VEKADLEMPEAGAMNANGPTEQGRSLGRIHVQAGCKADIANLGGHVFGFGLLIARHIIEKCYNPHISGARAELRVRFISFASNGTG
jgi:hypothetical protein